jgi:hypothetical protein
LLSLIGDCTLVLQLSCVTYKFVPYFVLEDGTAIAAEVQPGGGKPNGASSGIQLFRKFRRILQEMDVSARKHHKEFFLNALRKAREDLKEEELKEVNGYVIPLVLNTSFFVFVSYLFHMVFDLSEQHLAFSFVLLYEHCLGIV